MEISVLVTIVIVISAHGLGLVIGAGIMARKNIERIEKLAQAMSKMGAAELWKRAVKLAKL